MLSPPRAGLIHIGRLSYLSSSNAPWGSSPWRVSRVLLANLNSRIPAQDISQEILIILMIVDAAENS